MDYKLEILIKSFQYQLVNKATKQILEILDLVIQNNNQQNLDSCNKKIFQFPKSIKKYTVIRSPHIDKKARDQFQIQEFKNLIQLKFKSQPESIYQLEPNSFFCFSILENIKNTKFLGIQMQIKIESKTFGPICLQSKTL